MKMTKQEKGWVLYDVANSSYATIMLAVIFPIYFSGVCNAAEGGDYWWAIGNSIGTFIVAISAPFIGAFADIRGNKKKFFIFFLLLGLVFSVVAAFVDIWQMMLFGYILSYIGFAGSCLICDSFLTDVTTTERMDSISSWAYALGYIGGSTIPFLASIALVMFGEKIGVDSVEAVKYSVLIMVIWWAVFSIPLLKDVNQNYYVERPKEGVFKKTVQSVFKTAQLIVKNKAILIFLIAYFFYIDGVNTVIKMSTAYGNTLGLGSTGMILALMVTQIVAFPCAILFGKLSQKYSSEKMLICAILIYVLICVLGFYMGFGLEEGFLDISGASTIFWILATLVGTVQGGIQAISRSFYGKLIPPQNAGEYFGFFDIFGKFAAVLGPLLYAFVKNATGRSSFSILSIVLLFMLGLIAMLVGKKDFANMKKAVPIDRSDGAVK